MKRKIAMSIAVACLVIYPGEIFPLERSCEAFYKIEPKSFITQPVEFGNFSVTGFCGNKAVANRCRERARDRAHRCMTDHLKSIELEARGKEGTYEPPPITCRKESFDSSIVLDYRFKRLVSPLKSFVCNRFSSATEAYEDGYPLVSVELVAATKGGRGCSHSGTRRRLNIVCDGNAGPRPAAPPPPSVRRAVPRPRPVTTISWSANAASFRGMNGRMREVFCPSNAGARLENVWGDGVYTDDSSICEAAAHNGRISQNAGGKVTIQIRPGQASYRGTRRHGVTSQSYGQWSGSFSFVR